MPKLYETVSTQSCLDGIHAASVHGAHTHRTHYTKAMAFIQSHHGHFAALTRDGLLVMSGCMWQQDGGDVFSAAGSDDRYFEEPHLFEVDHDGMVSSREVREWLGY